jgi:hypothetical protein
MCLSLHEKYFKVHYELNEKGLMITHIDIQWPYAGISIVKTILHLEEHMIWLSDTAWSKIFLYNYKEELSTANNTQ